MSNPLRAGGPLGSARRRLLIGALLVAAGAVLAWRLLREPAAPDPPSIARDDLDPDVARAIDRARQRVTADPRSGQTWGELGMVLLIHDYPDPADTCLVEAHRLQPRSARWVFYRALVAVRGDQHRANVFIREAIGLDHPSPAYRLGLQHMLAHVLLEHGDVAEAEAVARDVYEANPDDPLSCYQMGAIAMGRDEFDRAEPLLRVAMTSPSARKKAGALLSVLLRCRGRGPESEAVQKNLADVPEDLAWPNPYMADLSELYAGAKLKYGEAAGLEAQGRVREALQVYLELAEHHPTAQAFARAGLAYAMLDDPARAEACFQASLERAPNQPQVHFYLAKLMYYQAERRWADPSARPRAEEQLRTALTHAAQATDIKPDFGECYLVAGQSYLLLGQNAAAAQQFQRAVDSHPEMPDSHLFLAKALAMTGDFEGARRHLKNAAELTPNDPRVKDVAALVAKMKG